MYFILNVFILILLIFFSRTKRDNHRRAYITIITVVMIIMSGLRNEYVGNDTIVYLKQFNNSFSESWSNIFSVFWDAYFNPNSSTGKDPAMWIVNKLIGLVSTDHIFFLLVTSALFLIPLGVFFYRNTKNPMEVAMSYLFFNTLYYTFIPNSAIRQSIALGFVLMAYMALPKRKLIVPILLVLIGSLFHRSALLVFLFILFIKVINPRDFYRISLVLIPLMLLFYREIGFIMADTNDIYANYGSGSMFSEGGRPIVIVLFYIGLYLMGLLRLGAFSKEETKNAQVGYPMIGAALTVIFVPLVRLDSTLIRVSSYFVVWLCLFIPIVLEKYSPVLRNILLLGIMGVLLYRSFVEPQQYAFFWQNLNPME